MIPARARQLARQEAQRAVADGRLTRRDECEQCGTNPGRALDGHHADYTRPLDVTWLCRRCHKKAYHPPLPPVPRVRVTLDDVSRLDFAKVSEVASILECDHRTVRKMIRSGQIPATQLGTDYRVPTRWLRDAAAGRVSAA